jgi:hypothetical protein
MSKQSESIRARRALEEANRIAADGRKQQLIEREIALRERALSAAQSLFIGSATAEDVITAAKSFLSFLRHPPTTARRPSASARAKASRKEAGSSVAFARRSASAARSRR